MTDVAIDTSDWRQLAFAATHNLKTGEGSKLGAIVRCMIKREAPHGPKFVGNATITSDGFVRCHFVDRNQVWRPGAFVGSFDDLARNLAGLADHCKFTDAQRHEFALAAQAWIAHDYRPQREKDKGLV